MFDLNKILREEYDKKNARTMTQTLIEMIEETLDEVYDKVVAPQKAPLHEMAQSRAKEFLLVLPKFTPSEAWGDPNSMERKQITRLFNVIGGGRTIEGKLQFLQRIVVEGNRIRSPRRIISSLIILESLSAVIGSFNAASAGFVFEGFLAALLQGEQEAEYSAKGNLPIQDLIAFTETDNPIPISLKLLRMEGVIEGSFTNLIDGLDEFGRMVYIVARKDGESIAIEEFTFNQENFIDALVTDARGKMKGKEGAAGKGLFQLAGMTPEQSIEHLKAIPSWPERYEALQMTRGYSDIVRNKRLAAAAQEEGGLDQDPETPLEEVIREEWALLSESRGGTQWAISAKQLPTFNFVDYKKLGELPYSSAEIEKVAERSMQHLNGELLELFSATKDLSENINKYFTMEARSGAIKSAERGIDDTTRIQQSLAAEIARDDFEHPFE